MRELDATGAQAPVVLTMRDNFRLMDSLAPQMKRIKTLDRAEEINASIVEAAQDWLMIDP